MSMYYRFSAVLMCVLFFIVSFNSYSQSKIYGDSASFGGGVVKTWIEVDIEGNPLKIGLSFNRSILNNLPTSANNISLNLPVSSDPLFKHVFFNWNPGGHPTMGIYTFPHFDMHFYTISDHERAIIKGGYHNVPVAPEFLPNDYIFIPEEESLSVPRMGVHYCDSLAPELNGETFTNTLIYGFYEGKMIFMEPMITVDYLNYVQNESLPIKQPQAYQETGYYPTFYEVISNSSEDLIEVFLNDFVFRSAVTSVDYSENTPADFMLSQNYPNPFNPATSLRYNVPVKSQVSITVYDVIGNETAILLQGEKAGGTYEITWNAENMPSGVYLCKFQAGNFTDTKKLVLLK